MGASVVILSHMKTVNRIIQYSYTFWPSFIDPASHRAKLCLATVNGAVTVLNPSLFHVYGNSSSVVKGVYRSYRKRFGPTFYYWSIDLTIW